MAKNFWGNLPTIETIRTPSQILKEQASLLADLTNGTLQSEVTMRVKDDLFRMDLDIVAPAVDNYTFNVLEASHGIPMYPVTVKLGWDKYSPGSYIRCEDEAELEAALEKVLSSSQVNRVISTLLAQSRTI